MVIRRALIEDLHAVALVHVSAWQHAYRGIVPQAYLDQLSIATRAQKWVEILQQGGSDMLVAVVEGHIVGFMSFGSSRSEPPVRGEAEVYAIYVASTHWSTGVGRSLWSAAQTRLRELNFARVVVWVLQANVRAIRFYERIGFVRSGGFEKSVDIGGANLPELRYDIAIAEQAVAADRKR